MREGGNSKKETSSEELVPQLAKDDDPGNEWQKQLDGEPDCGAIVKSMIQINSGTGEVDDDNDSDSTSDVVRSNRFSVLF